ncbi:MAG: hypothetical protein JWP06_13 [Candidatus Saccharibacteria bacterium]|nr:hypothetical protein [Candidatus Saccharibacteria bacterium]
MAERLATRTRDAEELTTVMHPTVPTHERAAPLTLEEEAALLEMEHHYDSPPIDPPVGPAEPTPDMPAREVPPPVPEFTLVMLDQSKDARDFARDAADTRLTQELGEGGKFSKFIKGIWKGNIAKDYYRQKYIKEAQTQIESSQDVLIHETKEVGARGRAKLATMERFQREEAEMINRGAGENKNSIAGDSELAVGLKGILREYAEGRLSDDALLEERTRVVEAYREAHGDAFVGEGLVKTDNILDIAQAVKGAIEHGESVDNVLANMKIVTGEARTGSRSEAHYNKVDKAINWLSKSRIGSVVPEAAIIAGTSIASGILRIGSSKTIGALAKTIAPGVGGALIAGVREWHHVKDERTQHSREMAVGKGFRVGDERREKMEGTRYETLTAQSITNALREHHESIFRDDAERPAGTTKDMALQAALDALTATEVRNLMADSQKIDLISYSDVANVGEERMQLALARAQLKVALRNELDDDARSRLGIDTAPSIEDLIEAQSGTFIDMISNDITAKDKAFRHLRNRRVAIAAGIGLAAGLTFGVIGQETMAAFDSTREGLVEQLWNGQNHPIDGTDHQTILHGLAHGDKSAGHHAPSTEYTSTSTGEHGTLELSNDHSIVHNPDGTMNFVDPNGNTTIENLSVNPDGSLSPESIQLLESHGMLVQDTSTIIDVVTHEPKAVNFNTFMHNHQGDTTHVTRDGWYDNNTPAPVFDKNELGVQWGGKEGTGITKTGYQLNLNGMIANGSFHGDKSVDYHEAIKSGHLKLEISGSKDTQTHPFTVKVNPDGTMDIPKDSPAGQFFTKEDGHAVFNGQYGEVSQIGDVDKHGVEHIRPLATIVGTGKAEHHTFHDIVAVHTPVVHPGYVITSGGYETTGTFTEMAPVIPIVSRRSLERLAKPVDLTNPNLEGFYYGGGNLENLRAWIAASPDRLRTRTEVTNLDGTKTWLEADGSPVERSVDRERSVLRKYLDGERATNPSHYAMIESVAAGLGTMNDKSRVAVNVPAWMEEGSLKHFLTEYTAQVDKDGTPIDPDLYEINIIVNRKTGVAPDESVKVIKDFIAEFERVNGFKPHVNYSDVELDPPFNNVGYARKLLTDAVALRNIQRTGQTEPLYIESEDADMVRVDKKTVINLINKLDANPHLDAVRGVQDRSPEYMKENDMLFLRRRAWDFFEIMARDKRFRDPNSPDWNFTWNRIVTGGWNTGYTAESYGLIGGYDSVPAGEDMSVGEKITMIRGNGNVPNLEVIGTVSSRSDSSPRRFINEIEADKGAYADFTNEADNKLIREKSIPELLDSIKDFSRITDSNKGAFESYISGTFNWAKSATPTRRDAEQFSHRLLFFLGFQKSDYDIVGDSIRVNSWDNVSSALEKYRARTAKP